MGPGIVAATILFCLTATRLPIGVASDESSDGDSSTRNSGLDLRAFTLADGMLDWLKGQQNDDGSFSGARGESGFTQAPVAVTAMSALAFMASGSTLGRGPYRDQVSGAIRYLIGKRRHYSFDSPKARTIDGTVVANRVTYGYIADDTDNTSRMHGHGLATLALAEAYGTYSIDASFGDAAILKAKKDLTDIREVLVDAVRLIEMSQTSEGGWYYAPGNTDHEGSVTITMIQALRAARDAGVYVDKGVIDDAVQYVRKSQNTVNGAFKYSLHDTKQTYALTAAAIATLNATGDYDSAVIDHGIRYMLDNDPVLDPISGSASRDVHPHYARLYAAQAYFQYRDPGLWQRWYPLILDEVEQRVDPDGGAESSDYGRVYSTANYALILLLPKQYLPIFQK